MPQRRQAAATALARTLRLDESKVLEEMLGNAFYMRRGLSQGSAVAVVDALKALQIPAYAEPDSKTQLGRRGAAPAPVRPAEPVAVEPAALRRDRTADPTPLRESPDRRPAAQHEYSARSWPALRRSGTRHALVTAAVAAIAGMLFADALLPATGFDAAARSQTVLWAASAAVLYVLPSLIAMCFRMQGWRAALPINFFVGITGLGWAFLLHQVLAGVRRNDVEQLI